MRMSLNLSPRAIPAYSPARFRPSPSNVVNSVAKASQARALGIDTRCQSTFVNVDSRSHHSKGANQDSSRAALDRIHSQSRRSEGTQQDFSSTGLTRQGAQVGHVSYSCLS